MTFVDATISSGDEKISLNVSAPLVNRLYVAKTPLGSKFKQLMGYRKRPRYYKRSLYSIFHWLPRLTQCFLPFPLHLGLEARVRCT